MDILRSSITLSSWKLIFSLICSLYWSGELCTRQGGGGGGGGLLCECEVEGDGGGGEEVEGWEAGAQLSEWKQEDHQAGPGQARQSHSMTRSSS